MVFASQDLESQRCCTAPDELQARRILAGRGQELLQFHVSGLGTSYVVKQVSISHTRSS